MKTQLFGAVVDFPPVNNEESLSVKINFQGEIVSASLFFFPGNQPENPDVFYVQVSSSSPLKLNWGDKFKVFPVRGRKQIGTGRVLNPFSSKLGRSKGNKELEFLIQLNGKQKEMLLALVRHKGIKALTEEEITQFSGLTRSRQVAFTQELEAEGIVRILTFSPLFILEQASLEFIGNKIVIYLKKAHQDNPDLMGISSKKIGDRFKLHSTVLVLSLKHLETRSLIKRIEERIVLADFVLFSIPEEEQLLSKIEETSLNEQLRTISLVDLQKRCRISSDKLEKMLALLIERKRIVQGKDGFFLHSQWLDEIIAKIRNTGKQELTVYDFKKMTGLSRKYAIPLLELLDQIGVTRRRGSTREVL